MDEYEQIHLEIHGLPYINLICKCSDAIDQLLRRKPVFFFISNEDDLVLVCWTHECKTEASTFFTTMYDMCSFQRGNFAQWYRCLACGRRCEGGGAPLLTCNAGSRSSVHFPRSPRYTFSFHQRAAQTIIPKGSIQAAIKCFWARPQPAKQESSCVRPSLPSLLVCVLKVYRGHCAVYIMHGSKSMMSSFWRVELTQLGVFLLETGGQEYEMWMAAVRLQSNLRVQLPHLQPRWSQETSAYENHEYSLLSLRMKCYFIKVGVAQRGRVSAHTSGTLHTVRAKPPLSLNQTVMCFLSYILLHWTRTSSFASSSTLCMKRNQISQVLCRCERS